MMPQATIVHAINGMFCETQEKALSLSWGLDNSAILHAPGAVPAGWLTEALDQLFIAAPSLSGVTLPWQEWRGDPDAQRLFEQVQSDFVARETFWQLPLWLRGSPSQPTTTLQYDDARALCHPSRPSRPEGEVYRRYDPRIRRTLSFRLPDPDRDTPQFTRWMNDDRVAFFWEQRGPETLQYDYLTGKLEDPHLYPLIGCFDDRPFGYFEVYWAAEDRIGRHYRWQPFDRGLHMLVGEQDRRGAHFVRSWLRGLTHYLYLDAPQTQRVVAEPRADNQRLFRHLPEAGYVAVKEFDFPHKRSRLILNQRHAFFNEVGL
ncbi:hydroxylysine acetyltransferase [Brenneria alni]|uniref:Hydroxylysine acetyltransferase n=1 Tax=Brenneria alni TaxID=71656 RepID=A0A421DTV4_9GAMM|nr:GNAT family N-acetyltransferase [Brenneria alni]RLM28152.1 hydroxylysine acetyltransferase [Brenneria alni]